MNTYIYGVDNFYYNKSYNEIIRYKIKDETYNDDIQNVTLHDVMPT